MAELQRRYAAASDDSIGVIRDVWLLAAADYLVCTFSSNVGRVAAELRLAREPHRVALDDSVTSLDKKWLVDP